MRAKARRRSNPSHIFQGGRLKTMTTTRLATVMTSATTARRRRRRNAMQAVEVQTGGSCRRS